MDPGGTPHRQDAPPGHHAHRPGGQDDREAQGDRRRCAGVGIQQEVGAGPGQGGHQDDVGQDLHALVLDVLQEVDGGGHQHADEDGRQVDRQDDALIGSTGEGARDPRRELEGSGEPQAHGQPAAARPGVGLAAKPQQSVCNVIAENACGKWVG